MNLQFDQPDKTPIQLLHERVKGEEGISIYFKDQVAKRFKIKMPANVKKQESYINESPEVSKKTRFTIPQGGDISMFNDGDNSPKRFEGFDSEFKQGERKKDNTTYYSDEDQDGS